MSRFLGVFTFPYIFVCLFSSAQTTAVEPDYKVLNAIAACRTVTCLTKKQNDVHGKIESTVLYAKWLMLDRSNRAASKGLLENLPATENELTTFMTLPDWHEGATNSESDMTRLDAVHGQWPRLLSISVQRFPQYLPAYIRYGRLAVNDIHSDYTGFERNVCRADQKGFIAAFHSLSADDQKVIREHVFDPYTCTPVFISEVE